MAAPGVSSRVFARTLKTLRKDRNVQHFLTNKAKYEINVEGQLQTSFRTKSETRQLHVSSTSVQPACCHHFSQHHDHHHRHNRFSNRHISSPDSICSSSVQLAAPSRSITTSSLHLCNVTPSSLTETDPYRLVEAEMNDLAPDICKVLDIDVPKLQFMTQYYFGRGKAFRPMVCLLMAKVCNNHQHAGDVVFESQRHVAMVAEMLHTASLVHDDVIDAADERRGLESLNKKYGQRQSILAGNYILSKATMLLAQIGNPHIISILSTVVEELISGEFMQLGSKEDENERFQHYLKKTYKKTASLIANSCKSVAIMSNVPEDLVEAAYEYGRNLGMSFQLVDDVLDFVASQQAMGKPTDADLKLGLANAPVLFAAMEHKELQPMIMRRFSEEGDVEYARAMVEKTDGVKQTMMLATRHSDEAIKKLSQFSPCHAREALARISRILLEREK